MGKEFTAMSCFIGCCFIASFFMLGYIVRGCNAREEIKLETIQRIAYAVQSGMITVNHDKIMEIQKANEELQHLEGQLDSAVICDTNKEATIKLPEEG
jgi:predicted nucleotidyltransferase